MHSRWSRNATFEWIADLLEKLGHEDDAYHAVALVLPDLSTQQEPQGEEMEPAGPLSAGAVDEAMLDLETDLDADVNSLLAQLPYVSLLHDEVPPALQPSRFFAIMCNTVLDNSPITFHRGARHRRSHPGSEQSPVWS